MGALSMVQNSVAMSASKDLVNSVAKFHNNHPNQSKVIRVSLIAIGIIAMSFPIVLPSLGAGSIVIAVAGGIVAAITLVAGKILKWFSHHDMSTHIFTPNSVEGGALFYVGDVPVLRLDDSNPYLAGKAHGFLLGEHIQVLRKKWTPIMHKILQIPRPNRMQDTIRTIKSFIPQNYLIEMRGITDGYNQWARNSGREPITEDEVFLFHMLPEVSYFRFEEAEATTQAIENRPCFGCSVVMDQDPNKGMVVGRNMDWLSLGENGKRSFCLLRDKPDGSQVAYMGNVPGFIGGLSGINSKGLSAFLNVSPGSSSKIQGMPSCFVIRELLENCSNVEETESQIGKTPTLGPFHCSVADRERGRTYHIRQAQNQEHTVRDFSQNQPLLTFNAVHPSPEKIREESFGNSDLRRSVVEQHLQSTAGLSRDKAVQESLAQPHVNNFLTTHSMVVYPGAERDEEIMKISFDNAFAAKIDSYRSLKRSDLFSN